MYDQINKELEKYFGEDGVKLVPDSTGQHQYCLRFNDHIEMTPANVAFAKSIVAKYSPSQWFDNETRQVDEWQTIHVDGDTGV